MGELFGFLGLTIGSSSTTSRPTVRRAQYECDITYGTNSEFGFDYLRDNGMATSKEQQVQRGYHFAIVDEVDSILIDEARTPLIISRPGHGLDPPVRPVQAAGRSTRPQADAALQPAHDRGRGALRRRARPRKPGVIIFKVKLGQPRNKGLLRMMEDPERRRAIDKAELSFYSDAQKEELFALKEELFFTIDERAHEADLSEIGPRVPESRTIRTPSCCRT